MVHHCDSRNNDMGLTQINHSCVVVYSYQSATEQSHGDHMVHSRSGHELLGDALGRARVGREYIAQS
jgi:hypothetical protein